MGGIGAIEGIVEGILDQDRGAVKNGIDNALNGGVKPIDIINQGLSVGLQELGELFADEEVFLPELLLAADIVSEAMDSLSSMMEEKNGLQKRGKLLIATVEGDVHDIGKSLVAMIMGASGYEVIDAGKDVPGARLLEMAIEHKPDIVGLSSLLSSTMPAQKQFIDLAVEAGVRDQFKVIVGGAPITRDWADKIGADGYAEDASSTVKEANRLLRN